MTGVESPHRELREDLSQNGSAAVRLRIVMKDDTTHLLVSAVSGCASAQFTDEAGATSGRHSSMNCE